jgi:hypothetical protein
VVGTFDHDAFANFDAALYQCGSGATVQAATSITQLALLFPSAASDRIVEDPTRCTVATDTSYCVSDPSCPGTPATCMPSIFGSSWSTSDDGVAGLFPSSSGDAGTVAGGWTLRSPSPWAVAQGGTPVTGITTDAFGSPRSASTPTVGAAEYAGTCSH